jgi:hypothetical protein
VGRRPSGTWRLVEDASGGLIDSAIAVASGACMAMSCLSCMPRPGLRHSQAAVRRMRQAWLQEVSAASPQTARDTAGACDHHAGSTRGVAIGLRQAGGGDEIELPDGLVQIPRPDPQPILQSHPKIVLGGRASCGSACPHSTAPATTGPRPTSAVGCGRACGCPRPPPRRHARPPAAPASEWLIGPGGPPGGPIADAPVWRNRSKSQDREPARTHMCIPVAAASGGPIGPALALPERLLPATGRGIKRAAASPPHRQRVPRRPATW